MSENPYRLARDVRGIGFKAADAITMKLGIEKTRTAGRTARRGPYTVAAFASASRSDRKPAMIARANQPGNAEQHEQKGNV